MAYAVPCSLQATRLTCPFEPQLPISTSSRSVRNSPRCFRISLKIQASFQLPGPSLAVCEKSSLWGENVLHTAGSASGQLESRSRRQRRSAVCMAADYYSTLGVSKSASKQDIKSAYRKLARQYHPDVNKDSGAEDKFKEISGAYEVLSDDQKRKIYDQYGEAGLKGGPGMGGGGYATQNPFDLFESFFGYDLSLDFTEAVFGVEKQFEVAHLETCTQCAGSGAKAGTSRKTCASCGGMGQVMRTQQTPFGAFSQVSVCTSCRGEGEVISEYCRKCGGEGRVRVKKNVTLRVPAGVSNGSTLRVRGDGDAGPRGGPRGDLYVFLKVTPHPEIERSGNDLKSTVAVDFTDVILGTVVKTVQGSRDLQIPAGTQPGDVLVLSKMGVPMLNKPSVRGDHFFTVKVKIPTRLSEEERGLVQDLASLKSGKSGRTGSLRASSRSSAQSSSSRSDAGSSQSNEAPGVASSSSSSSSGQGGEEEEGGVIGAVKGFAG
eukprot:jgi/Mesen1/7012/ME000365S06156